MRRASVLASGWDGANCALATGTKTSATITTISHRIAGTLGTAVRRWGYGHVETDRSPLRRPRARDRRLRRRNGRRAGAVRLWADLDAAGPPHRTCGAWPGSERRTSPVALP